MSVEALHWTPDTAQRQTQEIHYPGDVEALADTVLRAYQDYGHTVPGIELRRGATGAGLSIAAADFGWALILTDDDYDQHCTRNPDGDSGTVEVIWEEATEIPRSWFVPRKQALAGISRWLIDGGLASDIAWSDDCS